MVNSFRTSWLGCLLLLAGPLAAAPGEEVDTAARLEQLRVERGLPINLDADWSEFDRHRNRLLFRGLRITQGELTIEADAAEAERLDFDDANWTFRGNVVIVNDGTRLESDEAQARFSAHQLISAVLTGAPASFQQRRPGKQSITRGRARRMEYGLGELSIRLSGDAWVSDGANEVSGPRIAYEISRDLITAESDDSGQVKMKIIPPEGDGGGSR